MELTKVRSSNVDAVGYIEGVRVLLVLYRDGNLYGYPRASAELYAQLISAESIGKFACSLPQGVLISGGPARPAERPATLPLAPPCPTLTMEDLRKVAAARKGEQPDCSFSVLP